VAGTLALTAVTLGVCVLGGEVALRCARDPVDFLKPELVSDAVLPHVFRPGSAGHDAWGFRNREVPEGGVALLAIGDSMTYGVSAPRDGSWPAQLGRLRNHTVYILALGGYGPPEYLQLLETYGAQLAPREIVIGLYLGNDLLDASHGLRGIERATRREAPDTRPLGPLRDWLAHHSMLYQVAKHALPGFSRRSRERLAQVEAGAPLIELAAGAVHSTFLPEITLRELDLEREPVRRGLERSLELLDAIDARCQQLAARCVVALIPTKESVFADVAATALAGEERRRVLDVARAEDRARAAVEAHLNQRAREVVDLLPALRAAVSAQRTLYGPTLDSHPIAGGYAVFAEAIAAALDAPRGR
jgi:lysophospholipase L1-like esterase